MNIKNDFMIRAIELSINSVNNDGGPFGCVITIFRCNYTMHAEMCNYSFYV